MMKEATGEVSMTIVTLVAIAVIGAILATQWDTIKNYITDLWGSGESSTSGTYTDKIKVKKDTQ